MTRSTSIEWTHHTWNPFVGCTINTAGCTNCYAMHQAWRLEHNFGVKHYQGTTAKKSGHPYWTGKINMASEKVLAKPGKIKRPSLIFVNSMSDFFHENATDIMRVHALCIMAINDQHIYQILTKRPENIQPFLDRTGWTFQDHVWIGATVEHSKTAHRIDTLRRVPAHTHFLSVEPLIYPGLGRVDLKGMDWVIVGGESGTGARPMLPIYVREIRDQCIEAKVPFFFKQWGHYRNNPIIQKIPKICEAGYVKTYDPQGKGGSLLDDKHWKQFPGVAACLSA